MTPTPQVHTAVLPGGGVAVMDIRRGRGRWRHFNATAAALWLTIADGVPLDRALDDLAARFETLGGAPKVVRADLDALADQLAATGLLTARTSPPLTAADSAVRPPLPADTPLSSADRRAALLGMCAALVLLRCTPIRTTIGIARLLGRAPRREATPDEADLLHHAVRRAARLWPGRAACLEESLAVHIAAALRGRRATWVLGARTAPAAAHAWVEADGSVIGQDPVGRAWPYTPALKV
ncbi:lasso peptide biosynthesis B2 protein [Streptomyces sp. NPDC058171]